MEAEEDDHLKPQANDTVLSAAATTTQMDIQAQESQCETETAAESEPPPPPPPRQDDMTVPDKREDRDLASVEDSPADEGAGDELAPAEESGGRVEPPPAVPVEEEVEEIRDLVRGEERRGDFDHNDSVDEEKDGDSEGGADETKTEAEVFVADVAVAEETGKTVEKDVVAEEAESSVKTEEMKEEVLAGVAGEMGSEAVVDVAGGIKTDMRTEVTEEKKVEAEDLKEAGIAKAVDAAMAGKAGTLVEEVEQGKVDKMEADEVAVEVDVAEPTEMTDIVENKKEGVEVVESKKEGVEVEAAEPAEMTDNVESKKEGVELDVVEATEITDIVENKKEGVEMEAAEPTELTDIVESKKEGVEVDAAEPTEMADIVESKNESVEAEAAKHTEMTDIVERMEEGVEEEVQEGGDMDEMETADVVEERDKEDEMDIAEEAEKMNEVDEMEMAEEMEGAEEDVEEESRNAVGKRKRGKSAKAPARVPSRKTMEEDVCFICFDGGDLVLCDRRGCPKAYHPSCVNRDEAFFRTKGRWNCGWHLCSNCGKNAYYMCYTCTFSLCKGCIKDAVILCVRGNKGFCETCMRTVTLIERNEHGNKELAQVDFDDKGSWEYLFKDYWIDLKAKLSFTAEELAQAKNPWKGSDLHAGKPELHDELYDAHSDGESGSDSSSGKAEVSTPKKRKAKKRLKSRAKERDSPRKAMTNRKERASTDETVDWASKELLEFVMHMKNGDKSVCSQFDVQALLLEYIKRNKLRDPRRKSQIVCDSRLENLFGKPRVGHFEMLKLLESHFFLKEVSQVDDAQDSVVDTEGNQLEVDGNADAPAKAGKDKRRKSRKKGDGRGLQSNLDDYAAINMHNINLIYLRRNLVENLMEDTETFTDKVVGSFVRLRISGNTQKQDLYRLVQVLGTNEAAEPYRVGKKMTNFLLEILNLNKTEVVSIDIISNQDFTEDECKRLRQSIKCGLISRLTVGDIQEKAMALQAVRVEDTLESEITRLSHLRDRASDLGRRKELRECVEKLQVLKSPEERQRRLEDVPDIDADPKMDPNYESEEDEGETDDKRQENYLRPRGSGFTRRVRDPISPREGAFASNDSWTGTKNYMSMNRELSRNSSSKGFSNKGDEADGSGDMVNENSWSQGRDKESLELQSWERPRSASNLENRNNNSVLLSESVPVVTPEISSVPHSTDVTQSAAKINESEKIWHYQDPSGKIQGPFSIAQLRKWSNTGYFPPDLRIWRNTEKQDDSILLTDALAGKFQEDPSSTDKSSLTSRFVHNPPLSSPYSGNAGKNWKTQLEFSNSTDQAASASLEVSKYSTDRWVSETNLPSPTPARAVSVATKGQIYESRWSPTPAEPDGSHLGANPFSRSNGDVQRTAGFVPESGHSSQSSTPLSSAKLSGLDGTNISHGVSVMPKPETGILLTTMSAPQMPSQAMVSAESQKVSGNLVGASVNAAIDMKSLQNLIQPLVGKHAWGAVSVAKPEVSSSSTVPVSGSPSWGAVPTQKPEPSNSISMPAQTAAFGNWGDAPSSVHSSTAPFTAGNQAGVSQLLMPSDSWRAPLPGQSNTQPSTPNVSWGMNMSDNQSATPRQGPTNQNTGWGPRPGTSNLGWGGTLPASSNQGWVAPTQGPVPGNVNAGWVAPVQGQAPGITNPGWAAPVQGQAPGNASQNWVRPGQMPAPANPNPAWAAPNQGPPSGNANSSWPATTGNAGTWASEKNHNGDRYSSQRDRGSRGGDSSYSGGKPWDRQSSFGRGGGGGDSSRSFFKGQRVCKFHENGHCKKGASCDYLHT